MNSAETTAEPTTPAPGITRTIKAEEATQVTINALEPFKGQLKAQGFHLTRRVRDQLDALEFDRKALVRLVARGYLSDAARQDAARILAGRVFGALGVGQ